MPDQKEGSKEGVLEATERGRWRLRFERALPHAPERVWRALTEEERLAAWFPTTIEGELRAGSLLTFRFRGDEFPPSRGKALEAEAPRVLEFTWGYAEDDTRIPPEYRDPRPERTRFELEPVGEGCRMIFTTTYDRVGKSARDAAGWHACFDLLEAELAGDEGNETSPERWNELSQLYEDRFGPEASSIGAPESR
ncbi:MAG: SRPBCC family protein [Gemmatimonadota bacterium]